MHSVVKWLNIYQRYCLSEFHQHYTERKILCAVIFYFVPFTFSNNMLYPKEDKENRILLYAVSTLQLLQLILQITCRSVSHLY